MKEQFVLKKYSHSIPQSSPTLTTFPKAPQHVPKYMWIPSQVHMNYENLDFGDEQDMHTSSKNLGGKWLQSRFRCADYLGLIA